jgi:glyoxylate/hydroxypyruvate reductase A
VLCTERTDFLDWQRGLSARVPELELQCWPDIEKGSAIRYALLWRPPAALFAALPNLEVIFSLGAGVDHLWSCSSIPAHIPIARLVDAGMASQIVEYAVYGVLHFHRHFDQYRWDQQVRRWQPVKTAETSERRVGILGMGVLGRRLATALQTLGFDVSGWGRTPRNDLPCHYHSGESALGTFLSDREILVCLLPLTDLTRGLIDRDFLGLLPEGACFINCGRGPQVVEDELLSALDSGQLRGAMLDVLNCEPPDPADPLWSHPGVLLTPHIAAQTRVDPACAQIAENILRHRQGLPLLHLVDPANRY